MPGQPPGFRQLFMSVRGPTFVVACTSLLLSVPPQLKDMLQAVADDFWFSLRYQAALALVALLAWLWARTALNACIGRIHKAPRLAALPWGPEGPRDANNWLVRFWSWWPRLLLMVVGLSGCCTALRSGAWSQAFFSLGWMAVLLVVFLWRRHVAEALPPEAAELSARPRAILAYAPWPLLAGLSAGIGALVFVLAAFDTATGFPTIRIADRIALAFPGPAAALISLALMIGPISYVLMLFDVRWKRFGSTWSIPSTGIRVADLIKPMTVMVVVAVGMSVWSAQLDTHPVRMIDDAAWNDAMQPGERLALEDAFRSWVDACGGDNPQVVRPVIVAISGGASRAGLWGTRVLRAVDSLPDGPGSGILAISSVSGGSLGAADYVARRAAAPGPTHCRLRDWHKAKEQADTLPLDDDNAAIAHYGVDLLGPLLGNFLLNDSVRALLAGPLHVMSGDLPSASGDRADALERAFERAFPPLHAGEPSLQSPMLSLFYDRDATRTEKRRWAWKPGMPVWISNGTDVEGGERLLTVPVRTIPRDGSNPMEERLNLVRDWPFVGARDVLGLLRRDIRVSTAVHNSARFPYLSPTGNLRPVPVSSPASVTFAERPAQIADGGYFENSGVTTAFELEQWLEKHGCVALKRCKNSGLPRIEPILVVIDADAEPDVQGDQVPRCGSGPTGDPRRTLDMQAAPQLLAPLDTLYSVRSGHGTYAIEKAREVLCNNPGFEDGGGREAFFDFYLHAGKDGGIPLNWVLSREVEHRIWTSLTEAPDNAAELQKLKGEIDGKPPVKQPDAGDALVANAGPEPRATLKGN